MTDTAATERLPRVRLPIHTFTAAELDELRELYWQLPAVAEAAAELIGRSGPAPTGMPLERFTELTEQLASLIVEIDTILSSR